LRLVSEADDGGLGSDEQTARTGSDAAGAGVAAGGSDAGSGSATAADEDKVLVAAVARHDARSFRVLVERHLPALLAVARRLLADDAEAEDVAQEALVRLWQSAADLQIGADGVRPWLRRVVRNRCIDRIRSRRRTDVTDEVPEQAIDAGQVSAVAEGDLSVRVGQVLSGLPDRQRVALTLFHYEGLSQSEIGEKLSISDEAVESLLARARRAVRAALKDEWRQLLPETP
jgi:RNA polymerase sigma-70 factor (ECF subfamily)